MIGWIESAVGFTQGRISAAMADGPLRDLLVQGVVEGVGNVIVFVPQIALLFLYLSDCSKTAAIRPAWHLSSIGLCSGLACPASRPCPCSRVMPARFPR